MRLILLLTLAALLPGCLFNSAVATATLPLAFVRLPEPSGDDGEYELTETERLAKLREHSRHRLYDPAEGPRCAVTVTPTGARTWQLSSCEGELECWALAGGGYDCERRTGASPQL